MQEHAPRKKPSSSKEDDKLWKGYILPVLGNLKVSSLTREDILKLHYNLKHIPTTSNRVLSLLSKALNLSELWGYRPDHSNPCLHVKKYPENKRERFLNTDEIERLLEILDEEEEEGVCTETGHIRAFFSRLAGDDLADNKLFKLILVLGNPNPSPTPPSPTGASISISFSKHFILDLL